MFLDLGQAQTLYGGVKLCSMESNLSTTRRYDKTKKQTRRKVKIAFNIGKMKTIIEGSNASAFHRVNLT